MNKKNPERHGKFLTAIKRGAHQVTAPMRQTIYNAYIDNSDDGAQSRRNILLHNICMNTVTVVTSGIFLTGLVLAILEGESQTVQNQYLGTIVSLQMLANVMQIFTPFLIKNLKSYKTFTSVCRIVYFIINIVLLGIVPLLSLSATVKANLFVGLVFVKQVAATLPGPPLMRWHIGNIPDNRRADYFSIMQMVMPVCSAVASLIAGLIIDQFKLRGAQLTGILVIRGLSLILVFFYLRANNRIKEFAYPDSGAKLRLSDVFIKPMKNRAFMATVLIGFLWNLTANLPGQYFNAYLLEDLKVSYTLINFFTAVNIPLMLIMMPVWNRLVRKAGWFKTLGTALGVYFIPYLLNCLVFSDTVFFFLLSLLAHGCIIPGINLTIANLPYMRMPQGAENSSLAFFQASTGLGAFAGSYIGRSFILATQGISIPFFGYQIQNRQYIYLVALGVLIFLSGFVLLVARREKKKP